MSLATATLRLTQRLVRHRYTPTQAQPRIAALERMIQTLRRRRP